MYNFKKSISFNSKSAKTMKQKDQHGKCQIKKLEEKEFKLSKNTKKKNSSYMKELYDILILFYITYFK